MKPKGSIKLIREINSSIILDTLKQKAPISKYDISKETGLSAPTVTHIVSDLIKIGIVKEVGMGESGGGRPPMLLDLNLEGGFVIGIDISSDDITSIVVDFLGNTVAKTSMVMDKEMNDYFIFDKLFRTISDSIDKSGKDRQLFFGMGIGISGDVDTKHGVIRHASRLNWHNVPLQSIIENSFLMPVSIEENVRLMSFAENWYGAGKNYKDIICIRIGEDIGAGIIIDGTLYGGHTGQAGMSIGHLVVNPTGEICTCGQRGCLHAYASSEAIVKRTKRMMENRSDCVLHKQNRGSNTSLSVKEIADAARDGDRACIQIMDETALYIAAGIINMVHTLDPELVIVGGGIAEAKNVLFDPLHRHLSTLHAQKPDLQVTPSTLGPDAYALGAATLVLHQIFSTPKHFLSKKMRKKQKTGKQA